MLLQICSMLTIKTTEQHQYNLLWCLFVELEHMQHRILHKKWSFPLRISSVNVTKSALKKSLMENFIFCAVRFRQLMGNEIARVKPNNSGAVKLNRTFTLFN